MAPPENNQSSSHVSRLNSIYVVSCAIVWSIMLFSSMTVVRVNANNAHKENLLEVEQTAIASSAALNRIFGNIDWLSVAAQFLIRWSDFDRNYIKSELARLIERDANLNQVSLLDSAGRFIVSNLSSSVTMDLSDRDHIKPLLDDNGPDVLISDPLVGRISNKLSINVAKRIRDDSGRMTHIVVVSFAPDQLIEMLGKSRSEPCTGLALMREKVGGEIVGISPKGVHCGTTASWLGERCSGEDESNGSLRSVFASFLGSNDCLIRSKRVLDNGALGLVVWMGSEPWAGRIRGDIYVASGWLLLLAVILGGGGRCGIASGRCRRGNTEKPSGGRGRASNKIRG